MGLENARRETKVCISVLCKWEEVRHLVKRCVRNNRSWKAELLSFATKLIFFFFSDLL